jgi:hypothetical protein
MGIGIHDHKQFRASNLSVEDFALVSAAGRTGASSPTPRWKPTLVPQAAQNCRAPGVFFAGVQHALSVQEDIGFAAEYLRSDSNSDQSALVSGSYNQPQMFFLSANYPYQF